MVLKGFKVSLDSQSEVRKGIGAKSLKDLKEKVASKFELSSKDKIFIFLPGTNEIKLSLSSLALSSLLLASIFSPT
jgi:hypothetical protein